jgi:hypothetical protein
MRPASNALGAARVQSAGCGRPGRETRTESRFRRIRIREEWVGDHRALSTSRARLGGWNGRGYTKPRLRDGSWPRSGGQSASRPDRRPMPDSVAVTTHAITTSATPPPPPHRQRDLRRTRSSGPATDSVISGGRQLAYPLGQLAKRGGLRGDSPTGRMLGIAPARRSGWPPTRRERGSAGRRGYGSMLAVLDWRRVAHRGCGAANLSYGQDNTCRACVRSSR